MAPDTPRHNVRHHQPWAWLGLALLLLSTHRPADADTVYRWTDDQGKTHYAGQVPPQYQKRATALPSDAAPPTDAQRQQAQERVAKDISRAAEVGQPGSGPAPKPAPPAPAVKRPAQFPHAETDCATWARLYRESLDCFGPYRTTRGATRPEAFDHCNAIDEPPSRCRQRLPE